MPADVIVGIYQSYIPRVLTCWKAVGHVYFAAFVVILFGEGSRALISRAAVYQCDRIAFDPCP